MPEDPLEEVLARARRSAPEVELPLDVFRRYLDERVPPGGTVADLRTDDLYLACACSRGDASALRRLQQAWTQTIAPALLRMDRSGVLADETRQQLWQKLFTRDGDRARITEYAGRGSLLSWLRIAAVRTALNQRRKDHSHPVEESVALDALASPGADLELDYIQVRYRNEFRIAFRAAVDALTPRQRSLLRFQVIDGLTVDELGKVYRVHRATAARWVAEARETLLGETSRRISGKLGLKPAEFESMMNLMQSRLDVSLTGFLREK
jgi:RNA polymerase sigma-70 factor (ECF subfamily)